VSEAATPETVIAVDHLTVRYGAIRAVDAASLSVQRGQVFALLGRNGAGKSSLIRCLLGQQRPAAGSAQLFGLDAWRKRTALMRRVGVMPEEPDAPPAMNVGQLASFCASLYPTWDSDAVGQRLERFSIPRSVPFGRLSKGQKGQVSLTLALGHRPELMVLDDPTLGLDVVARKELYDELIGDLADRGTTVFIATHDLAGIEGIADRVAILDSGRLAIDEPIESLKARFRRLRFRVAGDGALPPETEQELATMGVVARSRTALGTEAVVSRFDEAACERLRMTAWLPGPDVTPLPLEEIFTALVGNGNGNPNGGTT
jgi:ABC-2 type transport system ATP-binding protein